MADEASAIKPAALDASADDNNKGSLDASKLSWYQTESKVVIDLLNKTLKELTLDGNKVAVTFEKKRLELTQPDFAKPLVLDLNQEIDPEKSSVKVLASKVVISLAKAESLQWPILGPAKQQIVVPKMSTAIKALQEKKKNFDALIKEAEKEEEEHGDANSLFKKLYSGSDDDTRRAMIKSYQTSGGKALSMNWGEVKNKEYTPYSSESEASTSSDSEDDDNSAKAKPKPKIEIKTNKD